ncbi:MAG TPA: bifunctional UDP-N-acetylglucosamine diphosphorylase/glucosamine-1-phosphate N-acetyltransferase GlmU [Candidatus Binatia bacterium]|nr:bifunctional UDP-N-acetylglucosamine diphosphorylase/glucosamine-1-phosphate N-acetyltransferase GlmU [Candidatus Binatia bacterium]
MTRSMPAPALHVIVLAAGQGTRLKSQRPKVLHEIGGRPLLDHVLGVARELGARCIHVVHGHGADAVRAWYDGGTPDKAVKWTLQSEQKGTAHAVMQALPDVPEAAQVLVLYGDVPLVRAATLEPLAQVKGLAVLTTVLAAPQGYGRILRDEDGAVTGIVEEHEATATERGIREVNTGIVAAPARLLKRWLARVKNDNSKKEYYLTDVVALAVKDGVVVTTRVAPSAEVMGVNDRAQLAQAERELQRRQAEELMRQGLTLRDPTRFDLRGLVRCGKDVTVDVGVVIEGEVHLGDEVYVGPYSVLRNVKLGAGTRVESHCVLDGAIVGKQCRIGPYARIRPDTHLADEVHVGNFVEVKKSRLGEGSKANHLAYLGDADVGRKVNIGAGTITCNYDGAHKHKTVIGDDVFVGSDTQLVAPVRIGAGATIGAGSTITKDAPPGALTVCRAKEQRSYPGWKRPQKRR